MQSVDSGERFEEFCGEVRRAAQTTEPMVELTGA